MNTALAVAIDVVKWKDRLTDFHDNCEDFWPGFDRDKQWMNIAYYDGPLIGICKYKDKYVFYHITDVTPEYLRASLGMRDMDREYAVYVMSDEQVEQAKLKHAQKVNSHYSWEAFQNHIRGRENLTRPGAFDTEFEDELRKNEVIGWIRLY